MRRRERGGIFFRLLFILFFLGFLALLFVLRHPLMRFAGQFWVLDEPVAQSDALIVLGDDNFYADRATRGVQLFREGKAPVIVASGRRLRPNAGIAELIEHDLVERGVPKDKIVRFTHDGDSTLEEAQGLARLAKERKWHSVIVVTANFASTSNGDIYGTVTYV